MRRSRPASIMTAEQYVEEDFAGMLGCPQCFSERWLESMKGAEPTRLVDVAAVYYRRCSEEVKKPHRCGKDKAKEVQPHA